MKKRLLIWAVVSCGLFGAATFVFVLAKSLSPSDAAVRNGMMEISAKDMSLLTPGVAKEFRGPMVTVIVLRPTVEQLESIRTLDPHVWDARWPGYHEAENLFVLNAASTRMGCIVTQLTPEGARPWVADSESRTWLGGFVDPCHDAQYDYAGRALQSREYTSNGFTMQIDNLGSPRVEFRRDGSLAIFPMEAQ